MSSLEQETEDQLVLRAQQALSSCNWEIGECASQWTQRYSRGRTDADFGQLIGLSGDQVYQRRRVWETFADVHQNYPNLKWSHFYVVINWDDAADCLQWANDMEATVAEMKAWRRAQHGEDLAEAPAEETMLGFPGAFLTADIGMVQNPEDFRRDPQTRSLGEPFESAPFDADGSRPELVASAARDSGHGEYTPFAKGARGNAPGEGGQKEELSSEQVVKKAAMSLERVLAMLTPAVIEDFGEIPAPIQQRLLNSIEELQARVASLV